MNAYTVSRLAHEAGVSVHVVRDYKVRGLLRPVARTAGGYGVFDAAALQRLCFVRAALEAGIGLDLLRVVSENGKNRTLSRSSAPRCKQPARRRAVDDAGESWALPATPALRLNRRAFHRAEGTEHAAVAGVGAQQRLAVAALVEELAGVGRHGFLLGISTAWARQHGLQDNGTHGAPCPVARK